MSEREHQDSENTFSGGVLKWVLRLYPKGYRREQESEIAGTYTAATADATRTETLREALDVARHGLRVRLRLTSAHYGGAVSAAALPYVLGSIAGLCISMFYLMLKAPINAHHETLNARVETAMRHSPALYYAPLSVLITASAVVLAALAGRWSWARWFAAATIATAALTILVVFELRRGDHIYVLTTFPGFEMPLMLAAFAGMVLAVPPDIRTLARQRVLTIAVALTVVILLQLAWFREGMAWSLITAMPAVVATVVAVALVTGTRNGLRPGAVALACAPWLIQAFTGDVFDLFYSGTQYVLLVALAIVLVLAIGSRRDRRAGVSTSEEGRSERHPPHKPEKPPLT